MHDQASLDPAQASLVRALYSGSVAARDALAELAPAVRAEIGSVTAAVFAASFHGAMLAAAAVSLLGILAAVSARPSRPGSVG